jgi:hypothetical protein
VKHEFRCIVSCQRYLPLMAMDTLIRSPVAVHTHWKQVRGLNEALLCRGENAVRAPARAPVQAIHPAARFR